MKTITYLTVLQRAAERAGKPREAIPTTDALMLRGYLTDALRHYWEAHPWCCLVPALAAVALTGRVFSKAEGTVNEKGSILGVYSANPETTTRYRALSFTERDGAVWVDTSLASVYVEWQLPVTDLDAITVEATLNAQLLPAVLAPMLIHYAAGHLKRADLQYDAGNELIEYAETLLKQAIQREPPPPPWRVALRSNLGDRGTV